jgi:hypothetical protein
MAPLTSIARRKFASGLSVTRYVWQNPANAGRRPQAVLRVIGFQAQSRLLHRRSVTRLDERSRMRIDLHRSSSHVRPARSAPGAVRA